MPRHDLRRNERIACLLPATLSWTDPSGSSRYVRGKCRDVFLEGLRIDSTESIPARSNVSLRVEKVDVAGSASVRYVRRSGAGFVIGVELTGKIRQQLLDALRESPSGSGS